MVNILLNAGADPNILFRDGLTILHCALLANTRGFIKTLLDAGADPNKPNEFGETPLNWVGTQQDLVQVLLNAGADPKTAKLSLECKKCTINFDTDDDLYIHRILYHLGRV